MPLPNEVIQLVRRTFGPGVEVIGVDFPGDWAVARLSLSHPSSSRPPSSGSDGPPSVIAKWLRADPRGWRTDPRQMFAEVSALQFTDELTSGLVPRVIAADHHPRTGGAVLLEDLAPREPLDHLIRRDGERATVAARRAWARAMGRLAAATAGHDQELERRIGDAVLREPKAVRLNILGQPWEKLRTIFEGVGLQISGAAEKEALQLRQLFAEPGPYLALSNGDMATNNFMITAAGHEDGRLIDFEFAHFDHALAHAANFFVPGPPWMVINDPVADDLEQEFRLALSVGIPRVAEDEPYENGISAGCVAMGFERCGNLNVMDSRPPGDSSRAQRVFTVESAAAAAEARGRWSALTDLLRDLARVLRSRWPDVDTDPASLAPYTARPKAG